MFECFFAGFCKRFVASDCKARMMRKRVLRGSIYNNPTIESRIAELEADVLADKTSSFVAAKELLELYFKQE